MIKIFNDQNVEILRGNLGWYFGLQSFIVIFGNIFFKYNIFQVAILEQQKLMIV